MTNLPQGAPNTNGRYRLVAYAGEQNGSATRATMVLLDPNGNVVDRFQMNSGGQGNGALPGLNLTLNSNRDIVTAYNINYSDFRTRVRGNPGFTMSDGTPAMTWRLDVPANMREVGGAGRDGFLIHSGGRSVNTHGCLEFVDPNNPSQITAAADADAMRFRRTLERLGGQAPASLELISTSAAQRAGLGAARTSPVASGNRTPQDISRDEEEIETNRNRNRSWLDQMLAQDGNRTDFGDISPLLRAILSIFLPEDMINLLFPENGGVNGNDPNAPNESEYDAQPQTTGERVRMAGDMITSGAQGRWEAYQREHRGQPVTHINPSGDGARQTSGFGPRASRQTTNGNRMSSNHAGLDLVGDSEIKASAAGVVLFSGRRGGYGNLVIIGHADGSQTRYGHMTGRNMPRVGSTVDQGQVIGEMGATGNVTGVHLHYEQRRDDGNGRMVAHRPVFGPAGSRQAAVTPPHDHDHSATPSLPEAQRRAAVVAAGPLAAQNQQDPSILPVFRRVASTAVAPTGRNQG